MAKSIIGQRLKALREAKGLSQYELCLVLDIKLSGYAHLEVQDAEKDDSIRYGLLRKLAKFYGMSTSELVKILEE